MNAFVFDSREKALTPLHKYLDYLVMERTSELGSKILDGGDYKKASDEISDGLKRLKECLPEEQYFEIVIKLLDPAIGGVEMALQEFFYRQGVKDGLELRKMLG